MHRARNQVAALERARWLAELAQAIARAQWLAWRLGVIEGDSEEARELYGRLETVRTEVDALRFGDWVEIGHELDPAWFESLLADSRGLFMRQEG